MEIEIFVVVIGEERRPPNRIRVFMDKDEAYTYAADQAAFKTYSRVFADDIEVSDKEIAEYATENLDLRHVDDTAPWGH
jgi:hypothetical protein